MQADEALIFIGAGASAPSPSRLPVFAPVRRAIGVALDLDADLPLSDILAALAPETILELLDRAGAPTGQMIADLFTSEQPNAVHEVVAQAMCRGAIVWTPNVDELVEKCDPTNSWHSYGYVRGASGAPRSSTRFVKPHGTVSDPRSFRFFASQVNRSLDAALAKLLVLQARDRDVFIAGYAGLDPDLATALHEAIGASRSAVWWDFPQAAAGIETRYESLVGSKLTIVATRRPAEDFVSALETRLASVSASPSLKALLATDPGPPAISLADYDLRRFHYAAGKVLELAGASTFRRRLFRGVAHGPARQRVLSAGALVAAELYSGRRRFLRRTISVAAAVSAGTLGGWRGPRPLRRAEIGHLRLLEREGRLQESLSVARRLRPVADDDPRLLLDIAAVERKAGRPIIAKQAAQQALQLVDMKGDIGVVGCRALFEVAETARMTGGIATAREATARLAEVASIFGGPRWARWAAFEGAALDLLEGEALAAAECFRDGARWFLSRHAVAAALFHLFGEAGACRVEGEYWRAREVLDDAAHLLGSLGASHQGLHDAYLFEDAQLRGTSGLVADYGAIASSPLRAIGWMATVADALTPLDPVRLGTLAKECDVEGYWFPAEVARVALGSSGLGLGYFGRVGWMTARQVALP